MENCHARFMQLLIRAHGAFDEDDLVEAVRTKKRIHKLLNHMMHIEMCPKVLEIMKELFDLEHDLSMLIIQELKKEVRNLSESISSSEDE